MHCPQRHPPLVAQDQYIQQLRSSETLSMGPLPRGTHPSVAVILSCRQLSHPMIPVL